MNILNEMMGVKMVKERRKNGRVMSKKWNMERLKMQTTQKRSLYLLTLNRIDHKIY